MMHSQTASDEAVRALAIANNVEADVLPREWLDDLDLWQDVDLEALAEDAGTPFDLVYLGNALAAAWGGIREYSKRKEAKRRDENVCWTDVETDVDVCSAVSAALKSVKNMRCFGNGIFPYLNDRGNMSHIWGEMGLGTTDLQRFSVDDTEAVREVAVRVVQAMVVSERAEMQADAEANQAEALADLQQAAARAIAYGASPEDLREAVDETATEAGTAERFAWAFAETDWGCDG
jgi:hypothetical protein